MASNISAFPQPRWTDLLSARRFDPGGAWDALYSTGRAALYWFFRSLDPASTVFMPSYHCGVEVQAAIDAGLRVEFYGLDNSLAVDEARLAGMIKAPGALLVVHYFGFVQPRLQQIAALCRERSILLVEDCAHAMLSETAGSDGAAVVYSFPKALPVLEGGAVRLRQDILRNAGWDAAKHTGSPKRRSPAAARVYAKQLLRDLMPSRVLQRRRQASLDAIESHAESKVKLAACEFDYASRLSSITRRLVGATDVQAIRAKRRQNWVTLHALLSESSTYRPVFPALPDRVCPLFLPLVVAEREKLAAKLGREGIGTWVFGRAPHPSLCEPLLGHTAQLRNHILCLPIHQQLTEEDMQRMTRVLTPELSHHIFDGNLDRAAGM